METLLTVIAHPFTWGLLAGLVFAAWAFFSGWGAKRALRREVRRLEEHCRTSSELSAKGAQTLRGELEELKEKNKNLEISLAALMDKPDRAEVRQLYLYDKAVHLMYERAPGFAPAWQAALKEAQAEIDKTSTGILPWIRRIIHPLPGAQGGAGALPAGNGGAKRDSVEGEGTGG